MPPTSLDAHPHFEPRTSCDSTITADATREASSARHRPSVPDRSSESLHADRAAYDTVRKRQVQLVVAPGVYDLTRWWVRPLSGGDGWLAAPNELEDVDGHAE